MEDTWNAQSCLSRDWGNVTKAENGLMCPSIWDGLTCWAPTAAGSVALSRCPYFKGSDITKSSYRMCSPLGEWLDRNGAPSLTGWTNYTQCLTPEIRELWKKLGPDEQAQAKFDIAANTRVLEFVGLSLSLAALLLSLLIFFYFRSLRNNRTKIHRNLFIALAIQVGIRLIVYTDQAITRSFDPDSHSVANSSFYMHSHAGENISGESTMNQYNKRGIDNTPILCEASYISLEYARTAMFMWMFVEGLYLHNMVTVTVFEEKVSPLVYSVIGWILPVPLTVAWAVVTQLHYGSATCWWGYNFTQYFWILEGPRLAVLMVNLAFLLNILRVLIAKLRKSNTPETFQAIKAVKAALLLLPLLGLTNLLNMFAAPLDKSPFQFALWSYSTYLLTSTQGLILAFLYCFKNGEVQTAVGKFIRLQVLGSSKHKILHRAPIRLSTLRKASVHRNRSDRSRNDVQVEEVLSSVPAYQKEVVPPLLICSFSNGVLQHTTLKGQTRLYNSGEISRRLQNFTGSKLNCEYCTIPQNDLTNSEPMLTNV